MPPNERKPAPFTFQPFDGWPWWLRMIGGAAVGIAALITASNLLEPYQPFATKSYVEKLIDPITTQQLTAKLERAAVENKLNALTVSVTTYQIFMWEQQLGRLDKAISDGTASDSDRQLAAQIRELVRQAKLLRGD